MILEKLVQSIHPLAVKGPIDREISGIAFDSRHVRPGHLFVALPGEHVDGARFIEEAIRRGAAAVVAQHGEMFQKDCTGIQVADARAALAWLAAAFHHFPSRRLQIIGVTGTNGKTSVAFMTRDILTAAGHATGLIGTVQYMIGERVIPASRTTPEAADLQSMFDQMLGVGCQRVVMEVSSHALVQRRVLGIEFDIAIFTNLTRDHLDFHQTMEDYFAAKQVLFRDLGQGTKRATAVINTDDPQGQKLIAVMGGKTRTLTYGTGAGAEVGAESIRVAADGTRFRVRSPWGNVEMHLGVLGRHNVMNALAAVATCGVQGIPLESMVDTLSRMQCVPGRLEEVATDRGFKVFVDYAHTDDALDNVLQALREITRGRLIAVFGCGGNRDRTKRPVMGAVADRRADFTILTSDNPRRENPREIIAQIETGFSKPGNYRVVEDRAEAIRQAVDMAKPGDIVLIAGKGHERYQEFSNTTVPFDDRQVVKDVLA